MSQTLVTLPEISENSYGISLALPNLFYPSTVYVGKTHSLKTYTFKSATKRLTEILIEATDVDTQQNVTFVGSISTRVSVRKDF